MTLVLTIALGLALTYVVLLAALLVTRPRGNLLAEALRLLPDLLRLLRRLAGDARVPRAARVRLWLLLGYLAIPIDLVPDFVPVLGYADDAIIVSLVLRSVGYRAVPLSELNPKLNAETAVIVMLETAEGIENCDAIAAVDGIDVLLIGSGDLTTDLGIPGQVDHPRLRAAYERVAAACRTHKGHKEGKISKG